MSLCIEFLSTRSGKALLFKQKTRNYLFGYYEGFQRHSIERGVRLPKITNVYLFEDVQVIPLLGFCLTVADMGRESLGIYGPGNVEAIFNLAGTFARRSRLKVSFANNNAEVVPIVTESGVNYVVRMPDKRGRLDVSRLDADFPRGLRKELKERRRVLFNERVYDGNDYMEDDVVYGDVCILHTVADPDQVIRGLRAFDIKLFICMNRRCTLLMEHYDDREFVVFGENVEVEYKSQYDLLRELSKIDRAFLVPRKGITAPRAGALLGRPPRLHALTDTHAVTFGRGGAFTFRAEESAGDQITFLGTGSAIPSKYRNVSAILYEEGDRAYLLDCGEDTLAQIDRAYGDTEILGKLRLVFISHSHADHHLGLYFVLRRLRHRVVVLCPRRVKDFLSFFGLDVDYYVTDGNDRREIARLSFHLGHGAVDVSLCPVSHLADSYAIRLHATHSITYSGDCRPSALFAEMSRNASVMIHEATFTDDLGENAIEARHSTISEARQVFEKSGAETLILTHFSQRFPKNVPSDFKAFFAFDFFRYNFKNKYNENVKKFLESLDK